MPHTPHTCRRCGHDRFIGYPRLQPVLFPVVFLGVPLSVLAAAGMHVWLGEHRLWAVPLVLAALPFLMASTRFTRRMVWGGVQCARCGDFVGFR